MTLKEKILENNKQASCKNCKYSEILNEQTAYCNSSDKLILPMHYECIRKCERFKKKKEND